MQKTVFLCQKKQKFKKGILDYTIVIVMTLQTLHDTHPWEVMNHAKFDVCRPSSFGGVKTDAHLDKIAL